MMRWCRQCKKDEEQKRAEEEAKVKRRLSEENAKEQEILFQVAQKLMEIREAADKARGSSPSPNTESHENTKNEEEDKTESEPGSPGNSAESENPNAAVEENSSNKGVQCDEYDPKTGEKMVVEIMETTSDSLLAQM